ncbi:MAG: T9SS type A sorting domain-containing protein [Saprospiraceae bacterium]|nr:T9SS type A sorting domain-containing protein [Saprospiraceae bacterium]
MKAFLCIYFSFCALYVCAQDKYDYIWVGGYGNVTQPEYNTPERLQGGIWIDFHQKPLEVSYFTIPINMDGHSSICDQDGQFLFYSDGCVVVNRDHEIMVNGHGIEAGTFPSVDKCKNSFNDQEVLAFPSFDESPHLYYLFHVGSYLPGIGQRVIKKLYLSVIDMSAEGGLGRVVEKNRLIGSGYITGQIAATRHANGRDWWIVTPLVNSTEYARWLFSPHGVDGPHIQDTGAWWSNNHSRGQAAFSPDGSKYARTNFANGLHLLDFDRCSGLFTNFLHIHKTALPDNENGSAGVGFSSSSRYLYLSWGRKLFQYDLTASKIPASRLNVGQSWNASIYQQRLGPDGKIYMSSSGTIPFMHVIHEPNKRGVACGFEESGLVLPARRGWHMPNIPWYRLYELPGSPCDTLGIRLSRPLPGAEIKVYPNPASHELRVVIPQVWSGQALQFRMYDALGRPLSHIRWDGFPFDITIDVSSLPAAMYFWEVLSGGERLGQGKVVVAR